LCDIEGLISPLPKPVGMSDFSRLPFHDAELKGLLSTQGIRKRVPEGTILLQEGAFVQAVPIVLEGLLKVERYDTERELLLYYIRPGESCIMSFQAALREQPSRVVATAEVDTELLLLPAAVVGDWHRRFPVLQQYYLDLFTLRYEGLISTIDQLAFRKLDDRLLHYLKEKAQALGQQVLSLTHQQIASELGTSREVVSRILKKLERDGQLALGRNEIRMRM